MQTALMTRTQRARKDRRRRRQFWLWIFLFVVSAWLGAALAFDRWYTINDAAGIDQAQALNLKTNPGDAKADAIVVLTGGPHRIETAIRLLLQGRARRILISGVNAQTTPADIARLHNVSASLFECCIQIEKTSRDTAGNARESARWLEQKGFSSLILVTADYHMLRSLAEFERLMPEAAITPYPVQVRQAPVRRRLIEFHKTVLSVITRRLREVPHDARS